MRKDSVSPFKCAVGPSVDHVSRLRDIIIKIRVTGCMRCLHLIVNASVLLPSLITYATFTSPSSAD